MLIGMPYLMKLMNLTKYPQSRTIFEILIKYDFNLNLHDLQTGESIVFTLIRGFDYRILNLLFSQYSANKGVRIDLNYYNKDGISPLAVALQLFSEEKMIRDQLILDIDDIGIRSYAKVVPYIWQILCANGASLSFPCRSNNTSVLQFVLKEIGNKEVLCVCVCVFIRPYFTLWCMCYLCVCE